MYESIWLILVMLILACLAIYTFSPISIDKFFNTVIGYKFPVDAVITFRGEKFDVNDNRGAYNYEIKYCLRSISKNMPWIRRIYVLQGSDSKVPSFFSENYKDNNVVLFNDNEIIPNKYLPTSNSDAIETFLTNLPGLSEQFIYFNDDMFVMKPISIDTFFTSNGMPKRVMFPRQYLSQVFPKYQILAPPSPGTEYWYAHIPIPYTITEINEYLEQYPEFIEYIRSIHSRSDRIKSAEKCYDLGLTFPCMQLHTNVDYKKKNMSNLYERDIAEYIQFPYEISKIKSVSKNFLCIGDHFIGSLEQRNTYRNKLKNILEEFFSEKSRAEI